MKAPGHTTEHLSAAAAAPVAASTTPMGDLKPVRAEKPHAKGSADALSALLAQFDNTK